MVFRVELSERAQRDISADRFVAIEVPTAVRASLLKASRA
jgi:hypothetical protein